MRQSWSLVWRESEVGIRWAWAMENRDELGVPVPLESILCTDELDRRPWRAPDHEAENRALTAPGCCSRNELVRRDIDSGAVSDPPEYHIGRLHPIAIGLRINRMPAPATPHNSRGIP
jgi:hypothetical protein